MLLLPIFLWLQYIVFISPCSTVSDEKAKIVDAAVKALNTTALESGYDLLALSVLGSQADLMMKTTVPIGAMVVEMANSKPQNDEYKALMDFQNRTEGIRRDIRVMIDVHTAGFGDSIPRTQYFEKVNNPIKSMKSLNDQYLDPDIYKNGTFIDDYKKACKIGDNAPESILTYLRYRLIKSCGIAITPREAQEIANIRVDLVRIFLRLQVDNKPFPDPGYYLSEFMDIYKQIDKSVLNEDFDVFDRHFTNYREAIHAFFDELRDRTSIEKLKSYETPCLLRSLITISNFNHPWVLAFVWELKNQLIEVAFVAASCANVSHFGDDESINKYSQEMSDLVTEISSFTSKWLNDSLISAWPSAHNGILNEQILQIAPKSRFNDNDKMKFVASSTHPLLIQTGIPNYFYEILIVRAVDENYELVFERSGDHCSLTKGTSGFDTIIGRMFDNPANKQQKKPWLRRDVIEMRMLDQIKYAEKLNKTIQSEMNSLYNAENLPSIAESLKNKIGKKFITEKDFHCWAIVREWSYEPCPTIDYCSAPYTYGYMNSTTILSYSNKGALHQHCQEFRFFFFV